MLVNILKQINEAEEEADRIFMHAKTQVADIEKDTSLKIDKIKADTDAEIIAKIKETAPAVNAAGESVKIKVDDKKFQKAVGFATNEFMAMFAR
jgi:vacuolar-type H+-ATPase subunit H